MSDSSRGLGGSQPEDCKAQFPYLEVFPGPWRAREDVGKANERRLEEEAEPRDVDMATSEKRNATGEQSPKQGSRGLKVSGKRH